MASSYIDFYAFLKSIVLLPKISLRRIFKDRRDERRGCILKDPPQCHMKLKWANLGIFVAKNKKNIKKYKKK
jgi:hypothetical protein